MKNYRRAFRAITSGQLGAQKHQSQKQRRSLRVETLEPRTMLNAAPVANDDLFMVSQNGAGTTFDYVLLNDTDADGDTLSVSSFTLPSHGALTDNGGGSFTYTPTTGYAGEDSFTYTIDDGTGLQDTGTVDISVNATFDAAAARTQILSGVNTLKAYWAGEMVAYGPTANVVADYGNNPGVPAAVVGTLGEGQIVALPHRDMLNMQQFANNGDTGQFYTNSLSWLTGTTDKSIRIAVTPNSTSARTWLLGQGYTNVVQIGSSYSLALGTADVLVGYLGTSLSTGNFNAISNFVRGGGGLFIADGDYGSPHPERPANMLLAEAGIGWASGTGRWGSGTDPLTPITDQVDIEDLRAMLDNPNGYNDAQKMLAGNILERLPEVRPANDSLVASVDAAFWAGLQSVNATPSSPVTDLFEQAMLRREMDLIKDLPPQQVTAHRTAEAVYGAIPQDAPRLAAQTVTLDTNVSGIHSTGLYVVPGEVVTVTVPASLVGQGYELRVNTHWDSISGHSSYPRAPYGVSRGFAINSTTVEIANAFGGAVYVDFGGQAGGTAPNLGDVDITIDGAIAAPYFVLGETTDADWISTIRNNPAPYAEFVSEHLAFNVPSEFIRTLDNPTQLMTLWNNIVARQDFVGGYDTAGTRTGPDRLNVDVAISVGYLHAGYPIQGPTGPGADLVDYNSLVTSGTWGWFHELGHEMQRQTSLGWGWNNPFTFPGDVEVTVNIFANAALEFAAPDTGTGGWGWSAHPEEVIARATTTVEDASSPNFDDKDPYPFYFQLADGPWGWQGYRDVIGSYVSDQQNNPSALPQNSQEEKDQWLIRWSEQTGYDMTEYMVDNWALEVSASALNTVAAMNLPSWMPLATNTARFQIDDGNSQTISGLGLDGVANAVGIATQPLNGTLTDNGDGTFSYTPTISSGTDSFAVTYQSSAGNTQDLVIEVKIGNGFLAGDVNLNGTLEMADVDQFILGWRSDTTGLTDEEKINLGDLNLDGTTNFSDWFILRAAWNALGSAELNLGNLLTGDLTSSELVHHWNFDQGRDWHDDPFGAVVTETIAPDLVGGADATLVNMTSADWVSGRQFSALEFDGTNDYLNASENLATTLGDTSSLSFWLNTTQTGGTTGANSPGITGIENTSNTNDIQWGWLDNTGRINLSVGGTIAATSANAVNDGTWHHIVITRDAATGDAAIYVDGVLSASGNGPTGARTTPFTSLGRVEDTGGTPQYFAGKLDQVHSYNYVIDAPLVETLRDNHAPKTYNGESNIISPATGTNAAPFSTHSATMGFAYDVERDSLTVSSFEQPAHGTVTASGDGSFMYTANSGFTGNDSFQVIVTDGNGGYSETTLSVVVVDAAASATQATAAFTDFQNIQAAGSNIDLNGWSVPRAIDWDVDGVTDFIVGGNNSVWYYHNSGTATAPSFDAGVRVQAGGSNISLGSTNVTIALADMTGDGVDDLIAVDSSKRVRVYANTAAAGQTPVYAASSFVRTPSNAILVLANQRFDIGDYNNDGLVDIVQGTSSDGISVYENVGTASAPRYNTSTQLFGGAYNLYPRITDLNNDGQSDLLRGINWGDVTYWFNSGGDNILDGAVSSRLSITNAAGVAVDMHNMTDGAIVDLADFNGDNIPDLLIGAHNNGQVFIAYGKDASANIDAIETIYDANLSNLGQALSANNDALLEEVNSLNEEWINWAVTLANPVDRQAAFDRLVQHINKYPQFLKHQVLDTTQYHHLASIAGQNWMTLHQLGPNTQAHLTAVADAMGLTGLHRTIYLENGLVIGDGANATVGQLESLQTFMQTQAGVLFPDAEITIDLYWGDGKGGIVNEFKGAKNVFKSDVGGNGSSEWASDLATAITSTIRSGTNADFFTYVVGHEVTHALDSYTRSRANEDLERRWGQTLVLAGGPDIVAGADGWYSQTLTQQHWENIGLYTPASQTWTEAWDAYWTTGAGSAWEDLSFMRGNIAWFYGATQESLATQGNQHWADSEGRLVGAVDRFRRGVELGIDPMKANITEVVHFLDLQSAGLNKVNLYDIDTQSNPNQAIWNISEAYLERNDLGYITQIEVEGRIYRFEVDTNGIITDVYASVFPTDGDVDLDGDLDMDDVAQFILGWRSDTTGLTGIEQTQLGDLNHDGTTNLSDWSILRAAWNAAGNAELNLGSLLATSEADFNTDGAVDSGDLDIWAGNFGTEAESNTTTIAGDTDLDGDVDGSDFLSWQQNFVAPIPAESNASANQPVATPAEIQSVSIDAAQSVAVQNVNAEEAVALTRTTTASSNQTGEVNTTPTVAAFTNVQTVLPPVLPQQQLSARTRVAVRQHFALEAGLLPRIAEQSRPVLRDRVFENWESKVRGNTEASNELPFATSSLAELRNTNLRSAKLRTQEISSTKQRSGSTYSLRSDTLHEEKLEAREAATDIALKDWA